MSTIDDLINSTSTSGGIVDVTPEMAETLINTSNYDNRKVKNRVVEKYAKMMENGEWQFSPETISISKAGRLLNGQHRLLAVVKSGVTCRFLIAAGFDDDVFKVLDRGATRTTADALRMEKRLAQVSALIVRTALNFSVITDCEIERASRLIEDVHSELMLFAPSNKKVFSSAPFRLACVAQVMNGAPKDYCFKLYRSLVIGDTESLPSIGHAVMKAYLSNRFVAGGGRTQRIYASVAWDVFDPRNFYKKRISVSLNERHISELLRATGYVKS